MKKGALKIKILVSGKRIQYLPELVRRKGVTIYKIKVVNKTSSIFVIDYNELSKFFAICKNMCYNTKVKGYLGVLSPIAYAIKNVALTVALIVFITLCVLLDGYVFGFKFEGSGKVIKNELSQVIKNYGVDKWSKFSDINYNALAQTLLKSNENLKFVSVYKRGNALVINTELGNGNATIVNPLTTSLVCDVDGVVESVKVLRGTAEVSVGSEVKKGAVLIGAYTISGEDEKYSSSVLGVVTVLTTEKYFYESKIFSTAIENQAILKATFLSQNEVVEKRCDKTNNGYEVTLTVRRTYVGG
ncbi:MAG: sporulation protein YqfD [Clostridia bacterium]|nr:sporulation protein YqfD [Clostridia bacterium]